MFTAFFTRLITLSLGPVADGGGGNTAETGGGKIFIENGTGLNQANAGTKDIRTLNMGANEDIDFQTFLDLNLVALNLNALCLLRIEADPANGGNIEVKPSAAGGWFGANAGFKTITDTVILRPGAKLEIECFAAATYLVDGAVKKINLLNLDGSNSVNYTITIVGRN